MASTAERILCAVIDRDGTIFRSIENSAESFHALIGDCFDIGTPFPSYDPDLIAICGDDAFFTSDYTFTGETQPWFGTVIFARRKGCDTTALSIGDIAFLSYLRKRGFLP